MTLELLFHSINEIVVNLISFLDSNYLTFIPAIDQDLERFCLFEMTSV